MVHDGRLFVWDLLICCLSCWCCCRYCNRRFRSIIISSIWLSVVNSSGFFRWWPWANKILLHLNELWHCYFVFLFLLSVVNIWSKGIVKWRWFVIYLSIITNNWLFVALLLDCSLELIYLTINCLTSRFWLLLSITYVVIIICLCSLLIIQKLLALDIS